MDMLKYIALVVVALIAVLLIAAALRPVLSAWSAPPPSTPAPSGSTR
jgi:hypothetical protein